MNILYAVHQFFPKHYTGTERFVLNLSRQMQRMGHRVKVLTYGITETEGFTKTVHKFLVKEYTYQGIDVISIRHKEIPSDVSFTIFDPDYEQVLEESVFTEEFDILHIAHPMRVGQVLKVADELGIPSVVTLTDFWLFCPRGIAVTSTGKMCSDPEKGSKCIRECYGYGWKDKILKRFNESVEFLKRVDVVVSPTKFLAGIFKQVYGIDVRVIRHGIDYTTVKPNRRYKKKGDTVVFGYIGTVLPHKGAHIICEALKLIENENIRVKIYGHYFHEVEYYRNLVKEAQKDRRIELLGEYKDEELSRIMNEVDCTIVPSIWWENSPLTVLTSLAYKVPVITINIGGAAELVKDGVNGFNFNIGDPDSLANILERIANNPEILNRIRENVVRPPRIEEEAFKYEKIYKIFVGEKTLDRGVGCLSYI